MKKILTVLAIVAIFVSCDKSTLKPSNSARYYVSVEGISNPPKLNADISPLYSDVWDMSVVAVASERYELFMQVGDSVIISCNIWDVPDGEVWLWRDNDVQVINDDTHSTLTRVYVDGDGNLKEWKK